MKYASAKSLGAAALGAAFVVSAAGSASAVTGGLDSASVGDALQDTTTEVRDSAGDVVQGATGALHSVAGDQQAMERLSGVPQEYGSTVADNPVTADETLAAYDTVTETLTGIDGNQSPSIEGDPVADAFGMLTGTLRELGLGLG